MLIVALAAALAGQAAPAPAGQWWLIHVERPRSGDGPLAAFYVDRASVAESGGTRRFATLAVFERPMFAGASGLDYRMEIRCGEQRIRMASAQPLDSSGRPLGPAVTNEEGFKPVETEEARIFTRLVCTGDRSGLVRVPDGESARAHAAGLFAEARRPPPPPPPLSAEELKRMEEWAQLRRREEMETAVRNALAEQCGEAAACRGFEARAMHGVEPVVAIEALECEDLDRVRPRRRSCRFAARHPTNGRSLSCTVELRETTWIHGLYWTDRRPPPPLPQSPGPALPMVPSLGPSTLACSAGAGSLVSP